MPQNGTQNPGREGGGPEAPSALRFAEDPDPAALEADMRAWCERFPERLPGERSDHWWHRVALVLCPPRVVSLADHLAERPGARLVLVTRGELLAADAGDVGAALPDALEMEDGKLALFFETGADGVIISAEAQGGHQGIDTYSGRHLLAVIGNEGRAQNTIFCELTFDLDGCARAVVPDLPDLRPLFTRVTLFEDITDKR